MTSAVRGLLQTAAGEELLRVPDEIPGLDTQPREVLGTRLVALRSGFAVAELEIEEQHVNGRGTAQGGILASVADAAAGWASDVTPSVSDFATVDISGKLVGAARLGDLITAQASTFHSGRRTCVNTVEVTVRRHGETTERPAAHFTCLQVVLA